MLGKLTKLFGNSDEKVIERLQPIVEEINALEDKYQKLSDLQLSKVIKCNFDYIKASFNVTYFRYFSWNLFCNFENWKK